MSGAVQVVTHFLAHNGWAAVLFWLALTGLLSRSLKKKDADAWVAWAEKRPRLAGLVQILRGLGLDVPKVLEGVQLVLLGVAQRQLVSRVGVFAGKSGDGSSSSSDAAPPTPRTDVPTNLGHDMGDSL